MATRAYTHVTAQALGTPIPVGPLSIQFYRVQGGTVGDTITIPASDAGGRFIAGAQHSGGADTSLSTNANDTQVVFTLTASSASTSVQCDVVLWVLL